MVLVQGGLEIPVKVTETMKNTLENKQAMTKINTKNSSIIFTKNKLIDNLKM